MSSLDCKALGMGIYFLFLWSICLTVSLKFWSLGNGEYVFITLRSTLILIGALSSTV